MDSIRQELIKEVQAFIGSSILIISIHTLSIPRVCSLLNWLESLSTKDGES